MMYTTFWMVKGFMKPLPCLCTFEEQFLVHMSNIWIFFFLLLFFWVSHIYVISCACQATWLACLLAGYCLSSHLAICPSCGWQKLKCLTLWASISPIFFHASHACRHLWSLPFYATLCDHDWLMFTRSAENLLPAFSQTLLSKSGWNMMCFVICFAQCIEKNLSIVLHSNIYEQIWIKLDRVVNTTYYTPHFYTSLYKWPLHWFTREWERKNSLPIMSQNSG